MFNEAEYVLYKLPQFGDYMSQLHLCKGSWLKQNINQLDLNRHYNDYLVAPFELNRGKHECYIFKTIEQIGFDFPDGFEDNLGSKNTIVSQHIDLLYASLKSEEQAYKTLVLEAISQIKEGKFSKLVCSTCLTFMIDDGSDYIMGFDLLSIFILLSRRYPNAMVSLIKHPEFGVWITASPEMFLSKRGNHYSTVALAGTKPTNQVADGTNLDGWGSKEVAEQGHVTANILQSLDDLNIRNAIVDGPFTVKAGPVSHLKTNISWTDGQVDASHIIRSLHPTSATLGSPKLGAFRFLREHEGYDRSLYCGFSGPIGQAGDFDLFVNLRTMNLNGNAHSFYVGAGITADSNPDAEWIEVLNKARTLLEPIIALKNDVLT